MNLIFIFVTSTQYNVKIVLRINPYILFGSNLTRFDI